MMSVIPMFSYLVVAIFAPFKYCAPSFDEIDITLPNLEAEIEKREIINLCLLGDYSMNTRALLSEVQYSKAPSDYIYSTLI